MRIPCMIEWAGHEAGWKGTATVDDKTVTVTHQKSFTLVRKRIRAALEAAGIAEPDLEIQAMIPKALEQDLERYKEVSRLIPALASEQEDLKLRLAQKLCNELNFSEREAAAWLGVSGAHISAKLRAYSTDTVEFSRKAPGETEQSGEPAIASKAQ